VPPPNDVDDVELPGEQRPPWWRRAVAYTLRRLSDRLQYGRGSRVRTSQGEGRALAREGREILTGNR
jgi:hypothetical protein